MWIRSQDKLSLRNYDGININYHKKTEILGDANIPEEDADPCHTLGNYDSEERAIEVLDEIQKALIENLSFGMTSNNKVYQMPEK